MATSSTRTLMAWPTSQTMSDCRAGTVHGVPNGAPAIHRAKHGTAARAPEMRTAHATAAGPSARTSHGLRPPLARSTGA